MFFAQFNFWHLVAIYPVSRLAPRRPLTEMVLLQNIAIRPAKTRRRHSDKFRINNVAEAGNLCLFNPDKSALTMPDRILIERQKTKNIAIPKKNLTGNIFSYRG